MVQPRRVKGAGSARTEGARRASGVGADGDYVGVCELAGAAGGGAGVEHDRVTGRIKFRRGWLARHGLAAGECRVIQVLGESMEPTLVDGCSILVNQAGQRRRVGRIFVVRTEDGLVVKRAGKDRAGAWQLLSDNPNKQAWPTVPWPADAPVIGEVKWAARTFVCGSDLMNTSAYVRSALHQAGSSDDDIRILLEDDATSP